MKWSILVVTCCICAQCPGAVSVSICNPTSLEPYTLSDVMVGTKAAIVIDSNSTELWSGGLFIEGDDRDYGDLLARGKDPNSRDWAQSHLSSAGAGAVVLGWKDSIRWGFDLYTDDVCRQSGKWFVLDYQAAKPGPCTVAFYDHVLSWTMPDPNQSITFMNTPTRDLVPDGIVNWADFNIFSSQWFVHTGNSDPNLLSRADFNMDGDVDLADLCSFADYWLFGIPGWQPPARQVIVPQPQPEPQAGYSIRTAEGLDEITIDVGQSVVLYIVKEYGPGCYVIDLEAQISDPNLGWIDNAVIDPNHPEASTARILFTPRNTGCDYWGPGQIQPEGIEFVAASLTQPIADGALASFVYTATAPGTVRLNLADYIYIADSQPLFIHQNEPALQMQASSQLKTASFMDGAAFAPLSSEPISETQTALAAPAAPTMSPDEIADVLENIRKDDPQLQQTINDTQWNEFIESVRNSE
ncbi:MAG: hypothetical protein LLF76_12055 [Planctomycetaceae bacterium]|nr:hypothetical protein [Planctomycetaceae bacterium]